MLKYTQYLSIIIECGQTSYSIRSIYPFSLIVDKHLAECNVSVQTNEAMKYEIKTC